MTTGEGIAKAAEALMSGVFGLFVLMIIFGNPFRKGH